MNPRVAIDVGWPEANVAAPKISDSAGAEITQFTAFRGSSAGPTVTVGCVATPIPGWVEDMRPAIEGRTVALAGASAALAAEHPIDARPDPARGPHHFELRDVRHLEESAIGSAVTFVGFGAGRVHTCFATCVDGGHESCRGAVNAARLEGSGPPPSPGIALGGVTWAVHHPRPFAAGAGLLLVLLGVLAVTSRKRPRFSGL